MEKSKGQTTKIQKSTNQANPKVIRKNPLREFVKKHPLNSSPCKTMSQLNKENCSKQDYTSSVSEKPPKELDQRELKVQVNNDLNCSADKSKKIISINNFVVEDRPQQEIISRSSSKKNTFSNHKLKMSDLITVTEASFSKEYELMEKLGEGTYGQVFKAKHKATEELRAVKIMKKRMMNQKKIKQFLEESSLLKKISHPSIIRIYEIIQHQNSYYVVMQYCKGGCITDSLDKFPKNQEKVVAKIMKQVFGALSYIHSLNIIHRDIKTQNIVFLNEVTNDNIYGYLPIKIIDFGLAVQMQFRVEHHAPVAGTIPYMAPEVFKGVLTEKSDIWSSAIMMIRMLTGVNPFAGSGDQDTINKINNKLLNFYDKPFSEVSQQARDLLMKILDKNPHKRPSAMQILSHPWFNQVKPVQTKRLRMIKQLQNYQGRDNLFSIIECYLTLKKTSQGEREQLAKIFSGLDKDCSGQIDKNEFLDVFRKYSPETPEDQLRITINLIDKDKSGMIDFNEFLVAMTQRDRLFMKESLSQAFDHFDKDKTGFLEKKELRTILKHCPKKEVEYFLQKLDVDKDNAISKEQFIEYLTQS